MIKVSNTWNQTQLAVPRPAPLVRVSMYVIDPATVGDAQVHVSDPVMFFSVPQQIMTLEEVEQNYATCEKDFWKLDGSMRLLPDGPPYEEAGIVYDALTNEYGYLPFTPKIVITFKQKFDAIGLTLNFDYLNEGYATEFRVRAYSDERLLLDETRQSSSPRNEVPISVDGFNKVEFDLYHFNRPFYRPRVFDVLTGLIKIWENHNLESATFASELSMTASTLPSEVLDITVDNSALAFNPEDLQADSWRYFLEEQPVLLEYGFRYSETTTEYLKKAYLYLSSWQNSKTSAHFIANGQFYFMNKTYYKGALGERTLYQLAEDVLFDLDLPLNSDTTYKWRLDESLRNFRCSNPLPLATHRDLLSMIAQAAGCIVYQDARANIHIRRRPDSLCGYTERMENTTSYVDIAFDKTLREVAVGVYSYTVEDKESELFSAAVQPGAVHIEYATAADVTVEVQNGTIQSRAVYASACDLAVSGANPVVTVKGRKLQFSSATYAKAYESFGDTAEVDNMLVSNFATAENMASFIGDYLRNRRTYRRTDKGEPALQPGDVILSQNSFSGGRPTIVTKQVLNTTAQGLAGELEEREVAL